jgi:hypothetical protein
MVGTMEAQWHPEYLPLLCCFYLSVSVFENASRINMDSKFRGFHGLRSADLLEGEPTFQFTSVDEMERTVEDFQDRCQNDRCQNECVVFIKDVPSDTLQQLTVILQDCIVAHIYTSTTRKLFELQ